MVLGEFKVNLRVSIVVWLLSVAEVKKIMVAERNLSIEYERYKNCSYWFRLCRLTIS